MSRLFFVRISVAALLLAANCTSAAHGQRSWHETESKTVYVGRYSNCDDGYYVLLPDGVAAHRGKAPNSPHGLRINLMNPSSADPIPSSIPRYIFIFNAYNSGKGSSLAQIVKELRDVQKEIRQDTTVSEPTSLTLGGLPALEFRSTFRESNTDLVELDVVALRPTGNVLYQLQALTTPATSAADSKVFDNIVAGFNLTKLPVGQCSSD